MKIILIGPRVYNGMLDSLVWNFQLPLQSLGHEVYVLDTTKKDNTARLRTLVDKHSPDLLFSIISCGEISPLYEPLSLIKEYTDSGKIKTFNWFADDIWRFDGFSSKICNNFTCCSTTEPAFVEEYKRIGYENIIEANWHVNEDLYSHHRPDVRPKFDVVFIGKLYAQRAEYIKFLEKNDIKVGVFNKLSFEQMIALMSNSLISLNFSTNPNAPAETQMKARPFEIAACGSLILSEYHPGMEKYFEDNREAVYFDSKEVLLSKLTKLLDKPQIAIRLSESGFSRYLKEHTSKHRLKELIEWIRQI